MPKKANQRLLFLIDLFIMPSYTYPYVWKAFLFEKFHLLYKAISNQGQNIDFVLFGVLPE